MVDIVNHRDLAQSRLATQFREATNLINYIRSLLREADNLETVFQDLMNDRSLDTAEGAQLDILGEIVGLARKEIRSTGDGFFGFEGSIGSGTFDSISTEVSAAIFLSISNDQFPPAIVTDTQYRGLLKATIIKNHNVPTINTIILAIQQGFDLTPITITEGEAEFTVTFNRVLDADEQLFILTSNLIPTPAGVRVKHADSNGVFVLP